MSDLSQPIVQLQMRFRVPVERLFAALVDPDQITRFWMTHSSGPLEADCDVTWEWRIYGASTSVHVSELTPNEKIVMHWGEAEGRSRVVWTFTSRPDGTSLLEVRNDQFVGTEEEVVRQAIDSASGFSFVLASAKAYLEHGVELHLVADRFPDGHVTADDAEGETDR